MATGDEPILQTDDIQGSILPGFAKDIQTLLGFRIGQPGPARRWLVDIASSHLTSSEKVARYRDRNRRRYVRDEGSRPDDPDQLAVWCNLGLSHDGLGALGLLTDDDDFFDEAFRAGLAQRSGLLGDPADSGSPWHPGRWVVGGPGNPVHVLVIVAGDTRELVEDAARRLTTAAESHGLQRCWQETAGVPELRSREHFGFADGISQPGVRGRFAHDPGRPVTRRRLQQQPDHDGPELAAPGVPLVWPGSFVFGYAAQHPTNLTAPGETSVPGPSWCPANGSFLVFRRLRQDVAAFNAFLKRAARKHKLDAEQLGALVVGRWRNGAPLARYADAGAAAGGDTDSFNDFDFMNEKAPDPLGLRCPNAAHIRKANPRATHTERGGMEDTLTRRILRRGLPYGKLLRGGVVQDDGVDRGLHFLCYQTSISDQFEFLMRAWFGSPVFPAGGGFDLLVGQRGGRPRSCLLPTPSGDIMEIELRRPLVVPTGGEYFFVPPISALRGLADQRGRPATATRSPGPG
jgi:Dyp-type peroxidase family